MDKSKGIVSLKDFGSDWMLRNNLLNTLAGNIENMQAILDEIHLDEPSIIIFEYNIIKMALKKWKKW